jgi:hypothetical protein
MTKFNLLKVQIMVIQKIVNGNLYYLSLSHVQNYFTAALMQHCIPARLQTKFSDMNGTCLLQFFPEILSARMRTLISLSELLSSLYGRVNKT